MDNIAADQNESDKIFQASSLSEAKRSLLDKLLKGKQSSALSQQDAIRKRPPGEPAPLSFAQ